MVGRNEGVFSGRPRASVEERDCIWFGNRVRHTCGKKERIKIGKWWMSGWMEKRTLCPLLYSEAAKVTSDH